MDLNENIDMYCERTDPSFWAEPFNAISNIAFIIVALLAFILYRKHLKNGAKKDMYIYILISLAFSIGVGSFLFHTFATRWAYFCDIIPIYTFAFYFIILSIWKIMKFNQKQAVISLIYIILVFILIYLFIPSDAFNNSVMYFPFVFLLGTFGVFLQFKKNPAAKYFLTATGVFILSLFFRTIDFMCCSWNPIGTHFLWHLLNGILIYLLLRIFILTQVNGEYYSM